MRGDPLGHALQARARPGDRAPRRGSAAAALVLDGDHDVAVVVHDVDADGRRRGVAGGVRQRLLDDRGGEALGARRQRLAAHHDVEAERPHARRELVERGRARRRRPAERDAQVGERLARHLGERIDRDPRGGRIRPHTRWAARACRTTTVMLCATASCSSRAMRSRSSLRPRAACASRVRSSSAVTSSSATRRERSRTACRRRTRAVRGRRS